MRPSRQSVSVFAPAKINLTLHVTGQRDDGYHLLDSLVVFAPQAADKLSLCISYRMALRVIGPFAPGVPEDSRNLCWKAAEGAGACLDITLDKHLPHAAGIGGGSSDAAAVLRGIETLTGAPHGADASGLGADVPVCLSPRAQHMSGIGDGLAPRNVPLLHAVLVNPGADVPTAPVFAALSNKDNPPMTACGADFRAWLCDQRNDLQPPALRVAPVISEVLEALEACSGAWLARMSGSGATCFALFDTPDQADRAVSVVRSEHPAWWVVASDLV